MESGSIALPAKCFHQGVFLTNAPDSVRYRSVDTWDTARQLENTRVGSRVSKTDPNPKEVTIEHEMLMAVEKCGARRRKIAALGVKKYQGLDFLWW